MASGAGASDTETVFDGPDPVAQTGGAAADRTMLGGVEMGSDGSVSWKLTDRAGDVVAVTGADVGVVAMAGYSDFGVTKTTADWDVLTAHSGELSDPTVGMDLYCQRAYDPLTANWGQADPYRGLLSAPQSLNRYAFVNGNPVTSRDVLGFSADAAEHYGGGAQSFFRSQHNAPRVKRKIRKTVPSPSPKPRVTQSADSLEKSSNPTGKCGPKCRQRQADGGRPGVGFRNLDRQEGNQPHGRAPKRHKHDDGFCLLGHNDTGGCNGGGITEWWHDHGNEVMTLGSFAACIFGQPYMCAIAGALAGANSVATQVNDLNDTDGISNCEKAKIGLNVPISVGSLFIPAVRSEIKGAPSGKILGTLYKGGVYTRRTRTVVAADATSVANGHVEWWSQEC